MKLHLHEFGERNVIKRCQGGTITINERTFHHSVVVTPTQVVVDWGPQSIADVTTGDLEAVAQLGVETVIVGTGVRQVFISPRVLAPLMTASVGYEIMDSGAAARTYNILASEGRNIAAAILLD